MPIKKVLELLIFIDLSFFKDESLAPSKVQNKHMRHRLYWQSAAVGCMTLGAVNHKYSTLSPSEQDQVKKQFGIPF